MTSVFTLQMKPTNMDFIFTPGQWWAFSPWAFCLASPHQSRSRSQRVVELVPPLSDTKWDLRKKKKKWIITYQINTMISGGDITRVWKLFLHILYKMELGNFVFSLFHFLPKTGSVCSTSATKWRAKGVELAVYVFCQSCAATENVCEFCRLSFYMYQVL